MSAKHKRIGRGWRIGWLGCALAAAIGLMAALSAKSSAQSPETVPNPPLEARCGLKVMLVLDESNSIHTFEATGTVRSAATAFVTALEGTGSPLAVTAFHSFARPGVPSAGYEEVTPENVSTFTRWINNESQDGYNPPTGVSTSNALTNPNSPSGTTNWEDPFDLVGRATGGHPDLVVFVTDGDPNTVNAPGNLGVAATGSGRRFLSHNQTGFNQATDAAVPSANRVKEDGARIFGIGVGPDVHNEASAGRLRRVTGDVAGINPIRDDYTVVAHFDELKTELLHVVASLCGSSLTITKYVKNSNGLGFSPSQGWDFTTTLDPTPGHTWLDPEGAGTERSATQRSDEEGQARFAWRLHYEHTTATVGVTKEAPKAGLRLLEARCWVHHLNGDITEKESMTEIPSGAQLGREEFQTCWAYNVGPQARLEVIKRLSPSDDPGRFNLLVDHVPRIENVGDGGATGPLLLGLGKHKVSEEAAHPTDLAHYSTSTTCVNRNNPTEVVHGGGAPSSPVTVNLANEDDNWVCTITNTNTTHGNLTVIKHLEPSEDPGRFNLLIDGSPPNPGSKDVGDGGTTGPVRLPFGTYKVSEEGAGQTVLSNYTTHTTCIDETTDQTVASGEGAAPVSVKLNSTNVQCTITNVRRPPLPSGEAFLSLRLHVVPNDDPGRFDLLIDHHAFALGVGDGGSTARLIFPPHTDHEVSLSVAGSRLRGAVSLDEYSISTRCRGVRFEERAEGTGPEPLLTHLVGAGDKVDCEILLTRNAPPTEPGGGGGGEGFVPTPPCLDMSHGHPECGDLAAEPHLVVSKQMPAQARVGDRVPIRITVKNVGHGTAHRVRLHETLPPGGGKIVEVADHGSLQGAKAVVWDLGSLSPGETRTVRATMLATRAGPLLDTAVASPANADPGVNEAAVRVRPAHPAPPPFTG